MDQFENAQPEMHNSSKYKKTLKHTFLDMAFCHKIHETMDKHRIENSKQFMLHHCNANKDNLS